MGMLEESYRNEKSYVVGIRGIVGIGTSLRWFL